MEEYQKFKPIPMDTPWQIMKIRYEAFRKMSLEQKAKITFDMCESVRELSRAGIRDRHPEYTKEQIELALVKLILGEELFAKVYPNIEITA